MKAVLKAIFDALRTEPVVVIALVNDILVLAAAFGLHLLPAQDAAILDLVQTGLALIARSQVTPVINLPSPPPAPAAPAKPAA